MRAALLFITLFSVCLSSWGQKIVVASDYRIDLPPLFWNDPCTHQKHGFGWLLQQRLWKDLGLETEVFQIDMDRKDSLDKLSQHMKAGKIDAYLTMPPMQNNALTTTDEPFFWLSDSLYQRKQSQWQYQSWEDLKGRRGMMIAPKKSFDRRSKAFKAYANKHLDLQLADSYLSAFTLLNQGEIDYLITYRLIGSGFIDMYQLDALKSTPIDNIAPPTHLAIAKNSALSKRTDEINQLLKSYREGSVATLLLRSSLKNWVAMINDPPHCKKTTAGVTPATP